MSVIIAYTPGWLQITNGTLLSFPFDCPRIPPLLQEPWVPTVYQPLARIVVDYCRAHVLSLAVLTEASSLLRFWATDSGREVTKLF